MTSTSETPSAMKRLKRSRILQVSSLMATASFTLAACGSPQQQVAAAPEADWETPFQTVQECATSGTATVEECNAAAESAQANTPRFASQGDCEQQFGEGQCEQKAEANGTSVFMPMLAGFLLGRMLSNGTRAAPSPLFRGPQGLQTPTGPYVRTPSNQPQEQAQRSGSSRAVARGGFGSGRSSGYGG